MGVRLKKSFALLKNTVLIDPLSNSKQMRKYLLDTNICVHLLRGRTELRRKISSVGWSQCCISDMTVIELFYGAECSNNVTETVSLVKDFISNIEIIPVNVCIREFSRQKARLRRLGTPLEDFDLLIGTTAVAMGYIMVTQNVKHLSRIENICIENWIGS